MILPSPDAFIAHFTDPANPPDKMQHQLSHYHFSSIHSKLTASSPILRAHLLSLAQRSAATWLSTTPSRPEYRLSDEDYIYATRLRLHLMPSPVSPQRCRCGQAISPDHFFLCPQLKRLAVTRRHDSIVKFLNAYLLFGGADCDMEPRPLQGERIRPDLSYVLNDQHFFLDVAVVHPTALSALEAAKRPYGAARIRESHKFSKYRHLERSQDGKHKVATLVPFIAESTGALTPTVLSTLRHNGSP